MVACPLPKSDETVLTAHVLWTLESASFQFIAAAVLDVFPGNGSSQNSLSAFVKFRSHTRGYHQLKLEIMHSSQRIEVRSRS